MQLLAFGDCHDAKPLAAALESAGDRGRCSTRTSTIRVASALLTLTQDPTTSSTGAADAQRGPFASLTQKPSTRCSAAPTRSATSPICNDVLLNRPRRTVLNPDWRWAVWYPLRRSGKFAQLPIEEQRVILAEHGTIGMSFGAGDHAHDVRLACHGLDKDDNDFVVGLIGKDLFPLSAIVQAMRKTQQTSLYLERLGPFFVGRAVWQSARRSPLRRQSVSGAVRANVGGRRWWVACSYAYASLMSVASLQARPKNDTPRGSPCSNPIGTVICG